MPREIVPMPDEPWPESGRGARERDGFALVFEDDFDGDALDTERWLPVYLPHWSARERTRPSFEIDGGVLSLRIADAQAPWCPDLDGPVRVSNLQTGHFSGPLGSGIGQHRFRAGLTVRDYLPPRRLFTPRYCRLELRARARLGPDDLASLWLIGYEDAPERSGEITLMEAFGRNVGPASVALGRGVKRIRDSRLHDELDESPVPIRLGDWHRYALDWRADGIAFSLDDEPIGVTRQSPDYPMQLMLNLYDLGESGRSDARFDVDYVRAWQRVDDRPS